MEEDFSRFLQAGGQITWDDWKRFSPEQKNIAIKWKLDFLSFLLMQAKYTMAPGIEEKLAIADQMKEFDGGALSQTLRVLINKMALQIQREKDNVGETSAKTNGIQS